VQLAETLLARASNWWTAAYVEDERSGLMVWNSRDGWLVELDADGLPPVVESHDHRPK